MTYHITAHARQRWAERSTRQDRDILTAVHESRRIKGNEMSAYWRSRKDAEFLYHPRSHLVFVVVGAHVITVLRWHGKVPSRLWKKVVNLRKREGVHQPMKRRTR